MQCTDAWCCELTIKLWCCHFVPSIQGSQDIDVATEEHVISVPMAESAPDAILPLTPPTSAKIHGTVYALCLLYTLLIWMCMYTCIFIQSTMYTARCAVAYDRCMWFTPMPSIYLWFQKVLRKIYFSMCLNQIHYPNDVIQREADII